MSPRLILAAEAGAFVGPRMLVIAPPSDADLALVGMQDVTVLQDRMPDATLWEQKGFKVVQRIANTDYDTALVFLPRAKAAARDLIAQATGCARRILVDGQKTDGVESLLKDVKRRTAVHGVISKAHGKLFWFETDDSFSDWRAEPGLIDQRWHVVPGVFSADGIDPGSELLVKNLPETLKGRAADLGAGWGYLSGRVLEIAPGLTELHLVEAQGSALECARSNVTDTRAQFHWADATTWRAENGLDAVIMNPPFHSGRSTDLELGRAFIAAASHLLRPGGSLWMVANRHLAYEQVLRDTFAEVTEIGGDTRYKVLRAKVRARR